MQNFSRLIVLYFFVVGCIFDGKSQLKTEYTTVGSIDSLVQEIFASPDVQIFNISFSGDYYAGFGQSAQIKDIGYFSDGQNSVGINNGIVLTGGLLDPPYGLSQPAFNSADYFKQTAGDSLLDGIISPFLTSGAAILEFDFIPNGDTIKFNYVFASDEYPYQICVDNNDIFAFHISGPGISGFQNIALIPGTTYPVGNNTVNDTSLNTSANNLDLSLCPTVNYPQYYIDHTSDTTFIFNGSTTVLTAIAATIPCETYHLRFAVAEGGSSPDQNSIVFLEANSFNSEPLSIESSVSYGGNDTVLFEGCGYAQIVFRRTYNLQQQKTYTLGLSGSAQNGVDYNLLPPTFTMQAGVMFDTLFIYPTSDFILDNLENIILTIGDTLCSGQFFETDIELIIHEKSNFVIEIEPDSEVFCDSVIFSAQIQGAIYPLNYNWNNDLGIDSTFHYYPIFSADFVQEIITLEVVDACGNLAIDTVNITFAKKPIANFIATPYETTLLNPIVEFYNYSSIDVIQTEWYFTSSNLFSVTENPIYHFNDTGNYSISLIVTNEFDCIDSTQRTILIRDIETLYIPTAFTPNGDGINDYFQVVGREIEMFEISIFNRWGEMIFTSKSLDFYWNGDNHPTDSFTYRVAVEYTDARKESREGTFLLLR